MRAIKSLETEEDNMEEMKELQEIMKDEPGKEVRLEILSTEEDSDVQME